MTFLIASALGPLVHLPPVGIRAVPHRDRVLEIVCPRCATTGISHSGADPLG